MYLNAYRPLVDERVDWSVARERIDLVEVATGLLGPPTGRRGDCGRILWWLCPFHPDKNPSFAITRGKSRFYCFGCEERGDAAALVMKLRGMSFPEAVTYMTGASLSFRNPSPRVIRQAVKPIAAPSGLPYDEALDLVETAAVSLWTPEGADALAYLRFPRCLTDETIRSARLGWTPGARGVPWTPNGIVLPWFDGDRLTLAKVRLPNAFRETFTKDRRPPKYLEAYRDPARLDCYPGPATIRPGRPLILVEGEFDALLLGQEVGESASVITLGSASMQFTQAVGIRAHSASAWYAAHDSDPAGEKAAAKCPARYRRVPPPGPHKDWTDAKAGGIDLARWWRDRLAGIDRPALYSWPELSEWRWGPAIGDETPGIG